MVVSGLAALKVSCYVPHREAPEDFFFPAMSDSNERSNHALQPTAARRSVLFRFARTFSL